MRRTVCLLFWLILLSACSGPDNDRSGLTDRQRRQIESDVINRFNAVIKYAEAGELENMLAYFDASGPGTYIEDGTPYASFQYMVDNYRATWKIRNQDYGVPSTRVFALSRDFVFITSSSVINTTTREGVSFQPRRWAVSTLWTFTDGEWLIHSFHQYTEQGVPVEEKEQA